MDPIPFLLYDFLLPVAIAAIWALIVIRRSGSLGSNAWSAWLARQNATPGGQARLLWTGVLVAWLAARWPTLDAFQTWPWTMPGVAAGLGLLLLLPLWALPCRWLERGIGDLLWLPIAAIFIITTLPWARYGSEGWFWLAGLSIAMIGLAWGARVAVRGRWSAVALWAPLCAAAVVIIVAHINLSQATALAAFAAAFGAAAIVGALRGSDFLATASPIPAAAITLLLIGNAQMRYAGSSSEAAWEGWFLRLAPTLLIIGPMLWAIIRRPTGRWSGVIGYVVFLLACVAAAALPMQAYLYEAEQASGYESDFDYGSIGK